MSAVSYRIDPQGSGSDLRFRFARRVEPGPQLRFGPARNMNPNLNIGSGSCANLVQHVREPDHGQSTKFHCKHCRHGSAYWPPISEIRRSKAWRCREAEVDNGNAWETLDAEVAFGPIDGIMVLEGRGRGRQRKKEGGINADEEGDECTQRKAAGEHDGELIADLRTGFVLCS